MTMKKGFLEFLRRTFPNDQKLHPIDHGVAKRWIKRRLVAVFPELRNDPVALEKAYRNLGLEPCSGTSNREEVPVFEMIMPQ